MLYVLEYIDEVVIICWCFYNKFDFKKVNGYDVCIGIIFGMVGVREENDWFIFNGYYCKRFYCFKYIR